MNSSASQVPCRGFGVGTVDRIFGMRESQLKKKQKEGEKAKVEEEELKKQAEEAMNELVALMNNHSNNPERVKEMLLAFCECECE
jgi:hypothetical protein